MTVFRPALCSVTFRRLSPAEVVDVARAGGIEGIEWGSDVHVPVGDMATARAVRRQTEEAGLSVISYGSYVAPPTDGIEMFARVLETAVELGAPNIRIWPGTRNRDSATYSATERAEVAAQISAFGALAEQAGVTLGLEFHPGSLADDTTSARDLMAAITAPNVFLYWQPRPGLPLDEALAEIDVVRADVSHTHVFAWDAAKARYPLADHADYWRRALARLEPGRWRGTRYAMMEFVANDAVEAFRADAAAFKGILADLSAAAGAGQAGVAG